MGIDEFDYFLIFTNKKCVKYNLKTNRFSPIPSYKCSQSLLNAGLCYDPFTNKMYKSNKHGIAMYDVLKNKWYKCSKKPSMEHSQQSILWINDKLLYVASPDGVEYYGLDKKNSDNY